MQTRDVDVNVLACEINDGIYKACSIKKERRKMVIPEDKKHLASVHFHAIARANLNMYVLLIQANKMNEAETYF